MSKSNRYNGFFNSGASLTSKRGRKVLSGKTSSSQLIEAITKIRDQKSGERVEINFDDTFAKDLSKI